MGCYNYVSKYIRDFTLNSEKTLHSVVHEQRINKNFSYLLDGDKQYFVACCEWFVKGCHIYGSHPTGQRDGLET